MSRRGNNPTLPGLGLTNPNPAPLLPTTVHDLSVEDLASYRSGRTSVSGRTSISTASRSNRLFGRNSRLNRAKKNFEIPIFIKRFFKPPTLDFEVAMWEILYLIISPKRVYKSLYYHKQTKNRWARDDPSFVILLSFFLTVSAIAWGIAYSPGFGSILKLILYMVFIDFFVVGALIATVGWFLANKFFRKKNQEIGAITEGDLEWAYCFDVHCNSFLAIWIALYMIQFLLLPVLTLDNWFALFLGNTLYFVSLSYYFVITFYGYNALPFLEHTQFILFPIGLLGVFYLVSLFGFNIAKTMTGIYFD